MTVTTTTTISQTAGNGSTTVFSIPFTFDAGSEVAVTLITDSTHVLTVQVDPTNYSISGSNVTMVVAPPTGTTLDIRLAVVFSQATDLAANSSLPAETLEDAYDELSKQIKQLKDVVDKQCIKLPVNIYTSTTLAAADLVAGQVVKINGTNTGIETGVDAT